MRATHLRSTQAHEEGIWTLAWVPGRSDTIITGSVDEMCKQWVVGGEALTMAHSYAGQTLGAISVDVDPTGTFAASSSLDSVIRVWHTADYRLAGGLLFRGVQCRRRGAGRAGRRRRGGRPMPLQERESGRCCSGAAHE